MVNYRLVERPAFEILGKKTWIAGQDNALFGQFWAKCQAEGLFQVFEALSGMQPGTQTHGVTLGVSCVEQDPTNRAFYYYIAIEKPPSDAPADLESRLVPASLWAVFEARGPIPDALVEAEMFAFSQWLPQSGYVHAAAPEMEAYPPTDNDQAPYCEFWLPIMRPA